ncbi:MAG TPA: TetR/AcrR family transcriptional regulator, partial [Vicinamibacterales bacterium]
DNVKPRKRGRPRGTTPQADATRERLYATALRLIGRRGYDQTTLRDIAKEAEVSVGLLYRYFPSKQAVVLALYGELSSEFASRGAGMPPGRWRDRFVFALETSLEVLGPHRVALRSLVPVLVGDPDEGVFGHATAFSRVAVQDVFVLAVAGASDAPRAHLAPALGRLLYLVHLAVLLWWLLDRSANQRATRALVSLARQVLPSASLALRMPPMRKFVLSLDELMRAALLADTASA